MALWDLLGKARGVPVWQLLARWGDEEDDAMPHGKIPYASVLFGETPDETRERAAKIRGQGFTAAKFGWGPMGQANEELDVALVRAARQGLGEEPRLMVDAGVAWGVDDRTAAERAARFAEMGVTWLEEPLLPDAVDAYARLAARQPAVAIAAGEGCGTFRAAVDLIDNGGVDFIQIDAGRIGGITVAYRVRRLAEARGIHYVNHTFKSHVSLAASLHVFATSAGFDLLEFPAEPGELCGDLVADPLSPDAAGRIAPRSRPGLGIELDLSTLRRFRKALRLEFEGEILFESR